MLAYAAIVITLRVTGKRTLSKLNAFDMIVTTLATALLSKSVTLSEGIFAFLLLCGLKFIVSWTCVRSEWVRKSVTSQPQLIVHDGQLLEKALKEERLTLEDVQAALRGAQLHDISEADAVVLEFIGTLSVIPRSDRFTADTLPGIKTMQ